MPRRLRAYLPGYTYHIVQRGNNRNICFFDAQDQRVYRRYLAEVSPRYGNCIHSYCLMSNHIHLLITPTSGTGISNLMKVLGSRYAQYINKRHERTGSLWEGRHKASAVDSKIYLLNCYRYIELNPVAARMVDSPADYPWSSYRRNALGWADDLITPHECYLELGHNSDELYQNYRYLFNEPLAADVTEAIERATHHSMPVGSEEFVATLEAALGRSVGRASRGRPRKKLIKK